ncbi:outer membrane beta-barrel protein [Chryseobacterium sp. A321]
MKLNYPLNLKFKLLLFVTFSTVYLHAQQADSLQTAKIEEVKLTKSRVVQITQKEDRYSVEVSGTDFQDQSNSWEALKTISILRVEDNEGVYLFNKTILLEINGVLMQMSSADIEDYLKNIDPKDIKTIEIVNVPNASYDSQVQAVVNVILHSKIDNYKIGVSSIAGLREKAFTNSSISSNVNYKKLSAYVSYGFDFYQPVKTSDFEYKIFHPNAPSFENELNSQSNRILRVHQLISNFSWDLSPKSKLVLMQDLNFSNSENNIFIENQPQALDLATDAQTLKFSQVFYHKFNKRNELKVGAQQALPQTDFKNSSIEQRVDTKVPIFNYFADYTNTNALGKTMLGMKVNHIKSESLNFNQGVFNPFQYTEQTIASFVNQNVQLSPSKTLSAGVRFESTLAEAFDSNSHLLNREYNHLLYNVALHSYHMESKKGSTISFKKAIQRPNYSYLNRFEVQNDVIGFVGDQDIRPTKYYMAGYEYFHNTFFFSAQAMYIEDFLSTFYSSANNNLVTTYQNFNTSYVGTLTGGYSMNILPYWNSKLTMEGVYFKLKDDEFKGIIKSTTPRFTLNYNNKLKLGKTTSFDANFTWVSNYNDGVINHLSTSKMNFILTKRFKNFDAILYCYDVFKGMGEREIVDNSLFYVNTNTYNDNRVLGLSLRWNVVSKKFKSQPVDEISDETLDRL